MSISRERTKCADVCRKTFHTGLLLLLAAGTVHAVVNSYGPAAGGSWGTAGNWSLVWRLRVMAPTT